MKNFVRQHIARARASVGERNSKIVKTNNVQNELDGVVTGYYVPEDSRIIVGRVVPFRDVLMLPCIDTAPDGGYLAVLATDPIQPAASSRSKDDFRILPERSPKRREKFTMRT